MELVVEVEGAELPATLTLPPGPVRAGVVALHGAGAGTRSYFLYEQLAQTLPAQGVAVLRYDRRASSDGHDVPLTRQSADALAALGRLGVEIDGAPVGLWGFSQGAWAAALAATAEPDLVQFLICVSCCGVSPAEQMRYGCAQQLSKRGYGESDVAELTAVRAAYERFLRGSETAATARRTLDLAAARPWFAQAYLPRTLPDPGSWTDMDFDPRPVLAGVSCPVLAFYGQTDEWLPVEASIAAWRAAETEGNLTDLTLVRLPDTDHLPTSRGREDPHAISSAYTDTLVAWLSGTGASPVPAEPGTLRRGPREARRSVPHLDSTETETHRHSPIP